MDQDDLTTALAERDRILTDLDIEGAKAFIAAHGGVVSRGRLDWLRVLHLARYEVTTMPDDLRQESRVYLARTGAHSVMTLPPRSPYRQAAMDMALPRWFVDQQMAIATRRSA